MQGEDFNKRERFAIELRKSKKQQILEHKRSSLYNDELPHSFKQFLFGTDNNKISLVFQSSFAPQEKIAALNHVLATAELPKDDDSPVSTVLDDFQD
jgi:hypothetical protein